MSDRNMGSKTCSQYHAFFPNTKPKARLWQWDRVVGRGSHGCQGSRTPEPAAPISSAERHVLLFHCHAQNTSRVLIRRDAQQPCCFPPVRSFLLELQRDTRQLCSRIWGKSLCEPAWPLSPGEECDFWCDLI